MNNAYFLCKYVGRILPEAGRLFDKNSVKPESKNAGREQGDEYPENVRNRLDLHCCSLFALYPGLDAGNALSFITSLHALTVCLDRLCRLNKIQDEAAIRKLYPALQDAVDPERTSDGYLHGYSLKEGRQVKKLVDQCRLRITALPSHKLVIGKMKRYIQLYIDLQSYRYLPQDIRREYVETWADYYLMRYRDINHWEFSAASDSLLGVVAMFAAASDPGLTSEEVGVLDEVYFPWICALQKLLEAYISAREDMLTEQLNFTSCYDNLKRCEERLSCLADKASGLCSGLPEPEFHATLVQCLLALYLSDPRAFFGMYGLASRNIIQSSPPKTMLYLRACRLLRRLGAC